jgi:vesicular inhibitory amino acid transporter
LLSAIGPKDERTEFWIINTLRTCLVLITIFVALIFPYFGTVMGAVGGLTDALQCFVLPPMIYLQVEGDKVGSYFQTYYFVIIFWGIATIIYTAYNAFFELF